MSENKVKVIYGPYGYLIGPEDLVSYMEQNSYDSDGQTNRVTLMFKRNQLLYDIENIAYVEGDVQQKASDNDHAPHQTQDIGQDGNVDRVTRILDLVHAWCVEMLYPYTKDACEDGMELDDEFKEEKVYTIVMNVPRKFSKTTANLLEKLIHEFMVARVLAEWFCTTKPAAAEIWGAKSEGYLEKAKDIINTRMGATTRPLRPF